MKVLFVADFESFLGLSSTALNTIIQSSLLRLLYQKTVPKHLYNSKVLHGTPLLLLSKTVTESLRLEIC